MMNRYKVVSFYTLGTGYEKEACALKTMLSYYKMNYHIEGIISKGSWQANTYHKAEFLKQMLATFPDQDIVWLDVDSIILEYPALFDTLDADLGVHYFEWAEYGRPDRKELSTAVMYIRNNKKMKNIICKWIEENNLRFDTGIWEQKNLQMVLERKTDIEIFCLPATYCKIYDLMSQVKDPIIIQTQASRRYKKQVNNLLTTQ